MAHPPDSGQLSEQAVIERITEILSYQRLGQTGHLDDDAYFAPASRVLMTTDMMVEGTHFRLQTSSAHDIGWKAAAVNISDIAAMGGQPDHLLVGLGLPTNFSAQDLDGLYQGLSMCAKQYGLSIVGGDTVRSPQLTVNVTAIGHLPAHHCLGVRSAARVGDRVMLTGPHGLSAAGLYALEHGIKHPPESLLEAHKRPKPRVKEALYLSKRQSHYALMDTSDGLADACLKIARQSNVQLIVDEKRLPDCQELRQFAQKTNQDALHWMLYGGEDFELLATLVAGLPLPEGWIEVGRVHALPDDDGQTNPDDIALLRREDGTLMPMLPQLTFSHFN